MLVFTLQIYNYYFEFQCVTQHLTFYATKNEMANSVPRSATFCSFFISTDNDLPQWGHLLEKDSESPNTSSREAKNWYTGTSRASKTSP